LIYKCSKGTNFFSLVLSFLRCHRCSRVDKVFTVQSKVGWNVLCFSGHFYHAPYANFKHAKRINNMESSESTRHRHHYVIFQNLLLNGASIWNSDNL